MRPDPAEMHKREVVQPGVSQGFAIEVVSFSELNQEEDHED
jgi:hypothetical protein